MKARIALRLSFFGLFILGLSVCPLEIQAQIDEKLAHEVSSMDTLAVSKGGARVIDKLSGELRSFTDDYAKTAVTGSGKSVGNSTKGIPGKSGKGVVEDSGQSEESLGSGGVRGRVAILTRPGRSMGSSRSSRAIGRGLGLGRGIVTGVGRSVGPLNGITTGLGRSSGVYGGGGG